MNSRQKQEEQKKKNIAELRRNDWYNNNKKIFTCNWPKSAAIICKHSTTFMDMKVHMKLHLNYLKWKCRGCNEFKLTFEACVQHCSRCPKAGNKTDAKKCKERELSIDYHRAMNVFVTQATRAEHAAYAKRKANGTLQKGENAASHTPSYDYDHSSAANAPAFDAIDEDVSDEDETEALPGQGSSQSWTPGRSFVPQMQNPDYFANVPPTGSHPLPPVSASVQQPLQSGLMATAPGNGQASSEYQPIASYQPSLGHQSSSQGPLNLQSGHLPSHPGHSAPHSDHRSPAPRPYQSGSRNGQASSQYQSTAPYQPSLGHQSSSLGPFNPQSGHLPTHPGHSAPHSDHRSPAPRLYQSGSGNYSGTQSFVATSSVPPPPSGPPPAQVQPVPAVPVTPVPVRVLPAPVSAPAPVATSGSNRQGRAKERMDLGPQVPSRGRSRSNVGYRTRTSKSPLRDANKQELVEASTWKNQYPVFSRGTAKTPNMGSNRNAMLLAEPRAPPTREQVEAGKLERLRRKRDEEETRRAKKAQAMRERHSAAFASSSSTAPPPTASSSSRSRNRSRSRSPHRSSADDRHQQRNGRDSRGNNGYQGPRYDTRRDRRN